jgi:hypothetical protein
MPIYSKLYHDEMDNLIGGNKMEWSANLKALWALKESGLVSSALEAKYLGCHGADHVLGLSCGRIVAVDLVLNKVVRINGVAQ